MKWRETTPRRAAIFSAAVVLGALDAGSYVYLRANSKDFVVSHRQNAAAFTYELGSEVSWRGEAPGATSGWWPAGPIGTWSVAPSPGMKVRLSPPPVRDVTFTALVRVFMDGNTVRTRDVEVRANDTHVTTWHFGDTSPVTRTAVIPMALLPPDSIVRIDFRLDEIGSPLELGVNGDYRRLGILLERWRMDQQP